MEFNKEFNHLKKNDSSGKYSCGVSAKKKFTVIERRMRVTETFFLFFNGARTSHEYSICISENKATFLLASGHNSQNFRLPANFPHSIYLAHKDLGKLDDLRMFLRVLSKAYLSHHGFSPDLENIVYSHYLKYSKSEFCYQYLEKLRYGFLNDAKEAEYVKELIKIDSSYVLLPIITHNAQFSIYKPFLHFPLKDIIKKKLTFQQYLKASWIFLAMERKLTLDESLEYASTCMKDDLYLYRISGRDGVSSLKALQKFNCFSKVIEIASKFDVSYSTAVAFRKRGGVLSTGVFKIHRESYSNKLVEPSYTPTNEVKDAVISWIKDNVSMEILPPEKQPKEIPFRYAWLKIKLTANNKTLRCSVSSSEILVGGISISDAIPNARQMVLDWWNNHNPLWKIKSNFSEPSVHWTSGFGNRLAFAVYLMLNFEPKLSLILNCLNTSFFDPSKLDYDRELAMLYSKKYPYSSIMMLTPKEQAHTSLKFKADWVLKNRLDLSKTSPREILKLSNYSFKKYKKYTNAPIEVFHSLDTLLSLGYTIQTLDAFLEKADGDDRYYEITDLAQSTVDLQERFTAFSIPTTAVSWISKIKEIETVKNDSYYGANSVRVVTRTYIDYLNMCDLLEIAPMHKGPNEKFKREVATYGRNVYDGKTILSNRRTINWLHDDLVDVLETIKDEEIEKAFNRAVKSHSKLNRTGKNYLLKVPSTPSELMEEGHVLSHCVGSYSKSISMGKTLIVFLRDIKFPSKPLYTIQLDPKTYKPRQTSGYANRPLPEEATIALLELLRNEN